MSPQNKVSMKSGLEGRNNQLRGGPTPSKDRSVSMKSGLEGRNNAGVFAPAKAAELVSMKSGLEGRNNAARDPRVRNPAGRLNEVRPRRPEQCDRSLLGRTCAHEVSMKSGLEGRNNPVEVGNHLVVRVGLNEVRPRRPEQSCCYEW